MMNRKHRVRVCGNLLLLLEAAKSDKLREQLRQQYRRTAARIEEAAYA